MVIVLKFELSHPFGQNQFLLTPLEAWIELVTQKMKRGLKGKSLDHSHVYKRFTLMCLGI